MKLFLASSLSTMKKQLLEYVGSLQGKKIACCLNPVDKRVKKEGMLPEWTQHDLTMFEALGADLIL